MSNDKHTISELFDFQTGEYIKVHDFFARFDPDNEQDQDKLIKLRIDLEKAIQNQIPPIYGCWCCKGLAALRAIHSDKRRKYFRALHAPNCKIKQNSLSKEQILRIKYNGQQESRDHQMMKEEIALCLEQNRSFKQQVEKVIVDTRRNLSTDKDSKEWKKPDVFSHVIIEGSKLRIAFELQITTTFLDVVISRQDFYKRDESYIIWIFKDFDKDRKKQRMMQLDIVVSNNKNAFVMNDETKARSIYENDLVLLCLYKNYYRDGYEINSVWEEKYVKIGDLTFGDDYQVYFHDSEKQLIELEQQVEKEKKEVELKQKRFIEKQKVEEKQKQELAKIENIVDHVRKAFRANKDSDIPYWIKNMIRILEDNETELLNSKLGFQTKNASFIAETIQSNRSRVFINFLLEQTNIKLNLNQPIKDGQTLMCYYAKSLSGKEASIAAMNFVRNGYNFTEIDKIFFMERFNPGNVKGDFIIDNYFLNLIIKLDNYEDISCIVHHHGLRRVLLALLSIKNDVFIDWGIKNFRGLANHILIRYESYGPVLIKALKKFGKYENLISDDFIHRGRFRSIIRDFEVKNITTIEHEEIFRAAFPELFPYRLKL